MILILHVCMYQVHVLVPVLDTCASITCSWIHYDMRKHGRAPIRALEPGEDERFAGNYISVFCHTNLSFDLKTNIW